jgi:hypothetical protein
MTKTDLKFTKGAAVVTLADLKMPSGDEASWEIETTEAGEVLVKSNEPANLDFTAAADPDPSKRGKKTSDYQFNYVKKVITLGKTTYNLPYTVYLKNGTETPVATGYLVIDTSGKPPGGPGGEPCKGPGDRDPDEGERHRD